MKKTTGRTIDLMFLSLTFSTALVLALIIHLTRQSGADTISTQNLIVSLFPELFPKHYHNAIWLMLELNSARKMAHIYEFGALGLFMTLMIITSPVGKKLINSNSSTKIIFLYSIGICAFASFCDQVHKTFIVYRHFDVHDLVLDAVGYVTAATLICTFYYIKKHPIIHKTKYKITPDQAL
jgi:hypothetical protein|nr:VanZ family protein [Butyrivibrio sp.]